MTDSIIQHDFQGVNLVKGYGVVIVENNIMNDNGSWLWPSETMDFWGIQNIESIVDIRWSHNCYEDYKYLAYQYYNCGYQTFYEVLSSGHDNIKSDMWFLIGIFFIRHSIELGLKSLLCRSLKKNNDIQNTFKECCHDLSALFERYCDVEDRYLTCEEKEWLSKYLDSLEEVDSKSDVFRFPFEDDFLLNYKDRFLDNLAVANNLMQAFSVVNKCIKNGMYEEKDEFDKSRKPEFFVYAMHGIGNCYLFQPVSDTGFYAKIFGYSEVIDYIYSEKKISNEDKFYPLMFMFRNTIELCLKRLFYSRVENGVSRNQFYSKRKSHLIKKDLWRNVKPVILNYSIELGEDVSLVEAVEKMIDKISSIDKNGDVFRYPTSYSLEYRFDNKKVDIVNIYEYNKALINFLDACDSMLDNIADYEIEMNAEY